MEIAKQRTSWQDSLLAGAANLPGVSFFVRSRGWPFLLTWAHRIAGLALVLYLLLHVYTLRALLTPGEYEAEMAFYNNAFFSFLEWAVAVPLAFHALNGSRLMLYEFFHVRDERTMVHWVAFLSAAYVVILAYIMLAANQSASLGFFWLATSILSLMAGGVVFQRVLQTTGSTLWKLQRVSGAFLLPLASSHMLLMHINYLAGHDAATVLLRMQSFFTKGIDLVLFAFILFHGTYGVVGVIQDYVQKDSARRLLIALTIVVMGICAVGGIALLLAI